MSLQDIFAETQNLPNIPKVVQELIQNFNNPDINADEIAKKIQMDQVISAKVMRLANSARYGAGRTISSIDSAVVMLGFDTLKTLVVASGVTGSFKDIPGFDRAQFWRDTFTVASISKLIAKHSNVEAETAFTVGMLYNIGELLIHLYDHEAESKIDALVEEGANRCDLQRNQYGTTYALVSAELAKRWNFPEEIVTAIAQHHAPEEFEDYSPLSGVVHVAKYFNECFKKEAPKEDVLGNYPAAATESMDLNLVALLEEVSELMEQEDDLEQLLAG